MNKIVDKLKNFWLGSEEPYDDGFDQLFKLNNANTLNAVLAEKDLTQKNSKKIQSNVPLPSHLKVLDNSSYSPTNEVIVMEPMTFNQAVEIIQYLRKGSSIVLNLGNLESEESQRLLDFVCGGIYALDGSQKRVGEGVFLLVPSSVNINSVPVKKENSKSTTMIWGTDKNS